MKEYLPILRKCPLFFSLQDAEILSILACIAEPKREYTPDSYLFFLNDQVDSLGIVLDGTVEVIKETIAGNRHILNMLYAGDLFGEGIVVTANRNSPVTVRCRTNVELIYIPYSRLIHSCSNACHFHTTIIQNLCQILGDKNYFLNQKIDLLTLKGMRQRLALYLLNLSETTKSSQFTLPFNRNELADFLNVSRTSMCRELGRMKEEGIIDFQKNKIHILDHEALITVLSDI